jgi:hypothetical protein
MEGKKMNKNYYKRVQIATLFIISFLGGMVHMALHSHFAEGKIFGWAESLMNALKAEGATLTAVADTAKLPDLEFMSGGMLYVAVLWFALMVLPAILPLLTEKRAWRCVTAIVGLVMTMMGIMDGIGHITMPGQIPLGLSGLILGSIPGIIAVVLAFDWAKAQGIVTLSTEEN